MPLEDKLRSIADHAYIANQSALVRQTRQLGTHLASVLREGSWSQLSAQAEKELSGAVDATRRHSEVLDAVGFLRDKVFSAPSGRIIDLKLKADLRDVQNQIQALFESKQAPERGFVYVAWCHRPEEYWYVGKARHVDRLTLAAHGKLARATAHATQLSLVFPSQSREEILFGVEASILGLVFDHTGKLPRLNERHETVPVHEGARVVDGLAGFLSKVAEDLSVSAPM